MAFTPNFVFADAVPAQQAVQYAQLAAQQQAAEDQAFNERFRNATQGSIARQNTEQQRMMSQSQMQQRQAENDKDRALAREGYTNAQTVAGIQAGRPVGGGTFKERQDAAAKEKHDYLKQQHETGVALAKILINPNVPESEKKKIRETALGSGLITVNQRGYYMPAFADPDLQIPTESIGGILSKRAGMGPSTISVTPMPSPGPRVPSPTDFQVPSPGTFSSPVPDQSSPFETPGFKVFRQSDFAPVAPDYIPEHYVPVDQPWMQPQY